MNGWKLNEIVLKAGGNQRILSSSSALTVTKTAAGSDALRSPTALRLKLDEIPSNSDGCCNDYLRFSVSVTGVKVRRTTRLFSTKLTCSKECSVPGEFDSGICLPNERGVCKGCYPLSDNECYTEGGDILDMSKDSKSCHLWGPNRLGMYVAPQDGSLACRCVDLSEGVCVDQPKVNSDINKCVLPDGKFGKVTGIVDAQCGGCVDFLAPQCVCAPIDRDQCLDANNMHTPTQASGGGCNLDSTSFISGITDGKLPNNICKCTAMPDNKCFDPMQSFQDEEIKQLGDVCADSWFERYGRELGSGVYGMNETTKICECLFV